MIDSAFNYGASSQFVNSSHLATTSNTTINNNNNLQHINHHHHHQNINNQKVTLDLINRTSIIENQSKNVEYKPMMMLPEGSNQSQQPNNHNIYKLNMMSPISSSSSLSSSPCRIQTIHQPHQYPPQPSSTGSASPNSNLSASASPTVFPSPSYSSTSSSQNDLTSNSSNSTSSSGYTWNTYAGLSSRPQFPSYAQYASDYYGNMSMTSAAAAAGAWFSTQDRLYQAWPTAAAAAAATTYGFPNLDDIAFQTQLQRRSIRCTCPNCTNEMSGLPPIVGPDERGRKQHICHIPGCERLYGKASHLKTHLRWHTGERPFLCLTCGKRFSRSDELQRHGRTHTNYRPYSCPICAKKFSRSDHLSKHKKTHFKDKKNKKTPPTTTTTATDKDILVNNIIKKEPITTNPTQTSNPNSINKLTLKSDIQLRNHNNFNINNNSINSNTNKLNVDANEHVHEQRHNHNINSGSIETVHGPISSSASSITNQMNLFKTEPSSSSYPDIPSGYTMYSPQYTTHHPHHPHASHPQQNSSSLFTQNHSSHLHHHHPHSHHHSHHHQQPVNLFYNRNDINNTTTSMLPSLPPPLPPPLPLPPLTTSSNTINTPAIVSVVANSSNINNNIHINSISSPNTLTTVNSTPNITTERIGINNGNKLQFPLLNNTISSKILPSSLIGNVSSSGNLQTSIGTANNVNINDDGDDVDDDDDDSTTSVTGLNVLNQHQNSNYNGNHLLHNHHLNSHSHHQLQSDSVVNSSLNNSILSNGSSSSSTSSSSVSSATTVIPTTIATTSSYDPLSVNHPNYHSNYPSIGHPHHPHHPHHLNLNHHSHQFKCPDYTPTAYPDFSQNSMMSSYHHHWPNYHPHTQINY